MMIVTKSTRMPSPRERMDRYLDALKAKEKQGRFDPQRPDASQRSSGLTDRHSWRLLFRSRKWILSPPLIRE